ncbi:zinc finger CCCH domain-containing protein 5-like [Iris pallida]|uniref:Zinc finger CCCH domain-containing protein 5-like n=1 Tax=Iris pallida TaxID=29817 RepID=A0AAX6DWF1_IRIPA|nr:zinc finger CCCH domain-containing protein 5-like [Iris pallida]
MDSDTGMEESMWQLRLEPGQDPPYPERPGEPDCGYYVRTGSCGFGGRCRFNHPRSRMPVGGAARTGVGGFPERTGQPVCQYFLKTGTCKYGTSCKYDHPRQGIGSAHPVSLNYYGYPFRPGEKECSYYVRTGQCKFGSTCKFHHPELGDAMAPSAAPAFYPTVQAPTMASWQVARPPMVPTPYMQPAYGSMMISPGVVQVPSWSPYPQTASLALSPGGQHSIQTGTLYGSSNRLSPSAPAYPGPYSAVASSGPSSSSQKEHMFPERPGQLECQYYMRTGDCKFGPSCKYHHPPNRIPRIDYGVNPLGLPLRPGTQPCAFYAQHGASPWPHWLHPRHLQSFGLSSSPSKILTPAEFHLLRVCPVAQLDQCSQRVVLHLAPLPISPAKPLQSVVVVAWAKLVTILVQAEMTGKECFQVVCELELLLKHILKSSCRISVLWHSHTIPQNLSSLLMFIESSRPTSLIKNKLLPV